MHGPFYALVRLRARAEMRRRGYSRDQITELLDACDDDVIDATLTQTRAAVPEPVGDEPGLIARLIEWLKSDEGRAFLAALIQILLLVIAA